MNRTGEIYFGQSLLNLKKRSVKGETVELNGAYFYRISNYDKMPPFFISLVSDSDHWMFISSKGGLSCGRKNPGNALFPYYTDDKIHDSSAITGSKSVFLIHKGEKTYLWEPFSTDLSGIYDLTRNIYKNRAGNKIIFEEVNHSLKLSFQYAWMNSDRYGFIKQSEIKNLDVGLSIGGTVIDGLQNILPYGVNPTLQSNMSTLVDGYKKCELDHETGLGIYTLSSIISDRPEPSEALKATTVWSAGLDNPGYLLSNDQIENFRGGTLPENESSLKGRRGSYFIFCDFDLNSNEKKDWLIIADISQGPSDVPATNNMLRKGSNLTEQIHEDISKGSDKLNRLVGMCDGIQVSSNELTNTRHFSNSLFNIMRGGIFHNDYMVDIPDFIEFTGRWNSRVLKRHLPFLRNLKNPLHYRELSEQGETQNDPDLNRIISEYLPLSFSRRHGDPSRPWNQFSIDVKKDDGSQMLYYQGNWRDIFQNWEALALSFPEFIESFIAKFVNASTVDGYNPYRITRDGIDWEILDPDDPWSNIGYWGDHQIIYLLRFLELSSEYHPQKLRELLKRDDFVYANVPYQIKTYHELLADPKNSITYNEKSEATIAERVEQIGSDGRLLFNSAEEIHRVNLSEKLLVSLLSKMSNFVPGGGIWMNTQRPEWNDANNALVGNGSSMVTLYYLRRFTARLIELYSSTQDCFLLAEEVGDLLGNIHDIFAAKTDLLKGRISDAGRRALVDSLGGAGSEYRNKIYQRGFSEKRQSISSEQLIEFLSLCLKFIDHSIDSNKRTDNLYHSYNLVAFRNKACSVEHLNEMLEGQVAVLESGYLSAREGLRVLDALRASKMYRQDQNSYTLYPNKRLPDFLEKNIIPKDKLGQSAYLLNELKRKNLDIIEEDENGNYHFNGSLRNANELKEKLCERFDISKEEIETICSLYVDCFNHKQFTGRSGTFFKYEGLGSIYWHMVSKLLLAVQELYLQADADNVDSEILSGLAEHYAQIKDGLGLKKTPDLYGAFPTDPYSHTPEFIGVQQPGMTGQVKEDIISRWGELGVFIEDGCIGFNPRLLSRNEFLESEKEWEINKQTIKLNRGELGFSICGTPVIYGLGNSTSVSIELFESEEVISICSHLIDKQFSKQVFMRNGKIKCIRVVLQESEKSVLLHE